MPGEKMEHKTIGKTWVGLQPTNLRKSGEGVYF